MRHILAPPLALHISNALYIPDSSTSRNRGHSRTPGSRALAARAAAARGGVGARAAAAARGVAGCAPPA